MPAPRRAILADIGLQNLDPVKAHKDVGKNGLFSSKTESNHKDNLHTKHLKAEIVEESKVEEKFNNEVIEENLSLNETSSDSNNIPEELPSEVKQEVKLNTKSIKKSKKNL